ncbi:hypothetical protein RHSIM_Rhsim06G0213000 [Rhododendron simsii]|uniref:Transmembrane protein n=1 Tax=Rhododendron simsii TaxID=118357 RepID=A0A834GTK8_RHOSS|nr:hypothetical protein RHSIM_Rhsim06G0213000 [Rhododendron simsii]
MISLIIFVAILPLLPITRPKAEEGSGTSNGAEGHPADHTLLPARTLLASSSAPRDHDAASASSSSPLAGGTECPLRPTTTAVSGSNTTSTSTSVTSGSAAPSTSIVTSGRDGAFNIERPREGPRDSNDSERPREGPRDSNDAEIPREGEGSRGRNDAEIPREGPQEGNDDDNGPFKLGKIFMGLSFPLAMALMIVRVQPQQGDSSTNLSSLLSILLNTVRATTIFCFAFTMLGMILKKQHLKVAKFSNCIGILLGVLDFFLMISKFTDDSLVWLVAVVAVVTLLASAYILRGEMGIQSQLSLLRTHRRDG